MSHIPRSIRGAFAASVAALVLAGCTVHPAPPQAYPAQQPVAQHPPAQQPVPQHPPAHQPAPDRVPAQPAPAEPDYPEPDAYSEPEPVPEPPDVYPQPPPPRPRAEFRRSGPIRCGGNQRLRLARVHLFARSHGLTITGNCRVVLVDSRIDAGRYGVRISGRGELIVRRSRIRGNAGSVWMSGSSTLSAGKGTFVGRFRRDGQARYHDRGDNVWGGGQPRPPRPDPLEPRPPLPPAPAPAPALKKSGPITCRGNDRLRLERVHISAKRAGVTATGRCVVVLVDSLVDAGGAALKLRGNARITLRRTEVNGRRAAVDMSGRSRLVAENSAIIGVFERRDPSVFQDLGGNTLNGGIVPPPPPADRPLRKSGPIICKGSQKLRLSKLRIEVGRIGVNASGNCEIVLVDSVVAAGVFGLQLRDNARITIRRSEVRGGIAAIEVRGRAVLAASNTAFDGGVIVKGRGRLDDRGGNRFSGGAPPSTQPVPNPRVPEPRPRHPLNAQGPITCDTDREIRFDKVRIDAKGPAVRVSGKCHVIIADSHVLSTGRALVVSGQGRITIKRSFVAGDRKSVSLRDRGVLVTGQTRYVGGVERRDRSKMRNLGDNRFE